MGYLIIIILQIRWRMPFGLGAVGRILPGISHLNLDCAFKAEFVTPSLFDNPILDIISFAITNDKGLMGSVLLFVTGCIVIDILIATLVVVVA